jgi:ATP/maltotriose-dependent transcriptional regulator MalT
LNLTEARMLAYVWRGMTNDDIGQELRLKLGTVKSRLSRLYRRLGVRHRSAAVLRAAEVLA